LVIANVTVMPVLLLYKTYSARLS